MSETLEQITEVAQEFAGVLTQKSNDLVIVNHEDLGKAAALQKQAKDEIKIIETAFKPHKENAFKAHRDLCSAEAEQLVPFKKITSILKPKILKFQKDEEDRLQKEQQEREKQQRIEEATAKQKAQEMKDKQVEELMDAGDYEKAEEIMEAPTPQPVAAYVPEPEKIKVTGAGVRKIWKGRVLDFSKVDDRFKVIDQQAINKMAGICKDKQKEPGLEFYEDTTLSGK